MTQPWDGRTRDEPASTDLVRLEFAAFSVKKQRMRACGTILGEPLRAYGRPLRFGLRATVAACVLLLATAGSAPAQLFGDRPPPVPPGSIPGVDSGGASSLAPSSGPASMPPSSLPPAILAPPSIGNAPMGLSTVPAASQPGSATPAAATGQPVLALSARFGRDLPAVSGGLVWRVYADKPDQSGVFKLVKEDRGATPNIPLPAGSYVVHVSLGLANAVRAVTVKQDVTREAFDLSAGGLRIEGRVGTTRIPAGQVTFTLFKGSQFDAGERAPIAQNIPAGDVALVPDGNYYIISNYGDGNSVVRSDIRVQTGKLTDVTVTHRAALIVLKLVSDRGGEALANTSWSVLTPGGDIVKESIGAFPRVVLAEGQYRAIAKYEGRVFERNFDVVNGVDSEIEVIAR